MTDPGAYQPSGAIHHELTGRRTTLTIEERGDAARTIAALLDLGAVAIEDLVVNAGRGAAGRVQEQRLVKADTGVAVGEAPKLSRCRDGRAARRVEDNEVVAHSRASS